MNSEVIQLKINPNIMTTQNIPPPPFFTNSTDDVFETDENLVCYSVPRASNSSDLNILNIISYFPEHDYNALLGIHETEVLLKEYAKSKKFMIDLHFVHAQR